MHQSNVISDDRLIDEVLAGDQKAFETLVNRHKRFAFNVAFNILRVEEEAEEAAQDAFMKAYKNLLRFDRKSKFTTWFYRIVTNESLSRRRKKKLDQDPIESAINMGEMDTDANENKQLVNTAITHLNEKDAELLTLFYLREFNLEEIAELVESTSNTVKVGIHRARQRMAKKMLELLGDEVYELVKE